MREAHLCIFKMLRMKWGIGLGTSVREVTRDKKELDLTALDRGCGLFLLSFGCDSSGYYRLAHGTALIPNRNSVPLPDASGTSDGEFKNAPRNGEKFSTPPTSPPLPDPPPALRGVGV